eukprot:TRINITY_DN19118_c0_g1_i1.p2 TRINITY_DN19118_c0_g1~~TRINITY_DN19118_c0_g1_i1.p2  ORF type:complete len:139 (+),score=36.73 TRINITY_DN19118_c0_g1_i1:29-418(+)
MDEDLGAAKIQALYRGNKAREEAATLKDAQSAKSQCQTEANGAAGESEAPVEIPQDPSPLVGEVEPAADIPDMVFPKESTTTGVVKKDTSEPKRWKTEGALEIKMKMKAVEPAGMQKVHEKVYRTDDWW